MLPTKKNKRNHIRKGVQLQQSTVKISKKTNEEFYDDDSNLYGPPPEYSWTKQVPWISILVVFNNACSVLIIPVVSKNKKPLPTVVIIKKPHKKLLVGFDPSIHRSQFDEYDHLILWQNKILTKLPISVISQYDPMLLSKLYENAPTPNFNFDDLVKNSYKKSLDEIIEIPIKLFQYKDIKLPQKLFGEAKKYLSYLGLISEGRSKHENKILIEYALKAIISVIKTTKKDINPRYLPMQSFDLALGNNEEIYTQINEDGSYYNRRSLNRISKDLLEAIKYCSSTSLDGDESIKVIKRTESEKIIKMYWDYKAFCCNRKTPPPLKIASK
jgi:hypothetical protein